MTVRLTSRWIPVLLTFAWAPHARADSDPVTGGKPLSHWVDQLKSPQAKVRTEAASRIADLREKALPAVGPLVVALAADVRPDGEEVRDRGDDAVGQGFEA